MANFPKLQLTTAGAALLNRAQGGSDTITFTKTQLGDGELGTTPIYSLTALISLKASVNITEGKAKSSNTYQIGAFFSNADISTGFTWREVGIYAKGNDNIEILYCYSNAGNAGDYIPKGTDERVEKYIYQSFAIANGTTVTALIDPNATYIKVDTKGVAGGVAPLNSNGKIDNIYLPAMDYASESDLEALQSTVSSHASNSSNPHTVTKSQVGLGNVPNVSTNNQSPTYTEAETLTNLTSGEVISTAFGKIKKAITSLISHISLIGGNSTYGHLRLSDSTNGNNGMNDGIAATPSAVKQAYDLANSKAIKEHSNASTIYGAGTGTLFGHLRVSDSVSSESGVSGGYAATPYAVKQAYDLANRKAPTNHASSDSSIYGKGTSSLYGHVAVSDSITSTANASNGWAASPYAVKQVNDIATNGGRVLLKTQNVIFNCPCSTAKQVASTAITGVDFETYDEYICVLDGTASIIAATGGNYQVQEFIGFAPIAPDKSTLTGNIVNICSSSNHDETVHRVFYLKKNTAYKKVINSSNIATTNLVNRICATTDVTSSFSDNTSKWIFDTNTLVIWFNYASQAIPASAGFTGTLKVYGIRY